MYRLTLPHLLSGTQAEWSGFIARDRSGSVSQGFIANKFKNLYNRLTIGLTSEKWTVKFSNCENNSWQISVLPELQLETIFRHLSVHHLYEGGGSPRCCRRLFPLVSSDLRQENDGSLHFNKQLGLPVVRIGILS